MTQQQEHQDERPVATRGGRPPWWCDDRGSGTIEYQGILAVAAILIAVVVGSTVVFPDATQAAICRIESVLTDGGGCETTTADGPTDDDLLPGVCALAETSSGGSGGVKVAFVKLGADWGLAVTEYSDGMVHAQLTNGWSGGFVWETGTQGGPASANASASLEGSYTMGDTWIMHKDDWPAFESQAREYFDQVGWRWIGAGRLWGARAPRDADVTSHEGGVELSASAGASLGMSQETDNPSVTTGLDLAQVGVEVSGGVSVRWEVNHLDGTETKTYTIRGEGSASASAVTAGAGVHGARIGSVSVTRSADGQLLEVSFETAAQGGVDYSLGVDGEIVKQPGGRHSKPNEYGLNGGVGSTDEEVTVTTTRLEVTSANRRQVERWLADHQDGLLAVGIPLSPVVPSGPDADDPFMQLLYEQGKTSRNVYQVTGVDAGFGASASLGGGIGFEGSVTSGERNLVASDFLGSPRQDGRRPFLPNSECSR